MNLKHVHGLSLLLACLSYHGASVAQETNEPISCLVMNRVRDTEVVDDDRILFYQGGGRIYLNVLQRTCLGLKRGGSFGWGSGRGNGIRNTRLCSGDVISVLDRLQLRSACKLGAFQPISSDQAKELLSDASDGSEKPESAVPNQTDDVHE